MKKLMLVLAAAGAIASVGSVAQAETVTVPGVGYLETDGSYVLAEGTNNANGPLSGYIFVGGGRICADDNGDWNGGAPNGQGGGQSPTCSS